MRRQERKADSSEALLLALQGWQSGIWTAVPGIIQSFDAASQTCVVQPATQVKVTDQNGVASWISLPLLLDVLVQFPSGGGVTITFPVTKGDECLVILASRCIDGWWQTGQITPQAELRMHDLSDGIALVGIRSKPRLLSGISTSSAQIRTDDGQSTIDVNPTTHNITVTTTGNVSTTSVNATITATAVVIKAGSIALQNAGTVLKKLVNSLFADWALTHVHSNGNGGGNTGIPTTSPSAGYETSVVEAE